jgi:prepilin-type N-terminal cleavage/methylation domain-containing protein/prepilin-type processing-associated H-X9-DG protein
MTAVSFVFYGALTGHLSGALSLIPATIRLSVVQNRLDGLAQQAPQGRTFMSRTRTCRYRRAASGFTLIELLVVIAILGTLVSLLVPAVQSAREVARRAQCTNNLKQLALAASNYAAVVGCYPPGVYWCLLTGHLAGTLGTNCGPMVHLTPYFEQGQVYNAINFEQAIYYNANLTVHGIGIGSLWCPSDTTVQGVETLHDTGGTLLYEPTPGGRVRMAYSSYAGVCGPWWPNTWSVPGMGMGARKTHAQIKANELGMFGVCSDVLPASVLDGTSHTLLFAEHGHGLIHADVRPSWQWWVSGNLGDTLVTTMFPVNPQRTLGGGKAGYPSGIFLVSASSLHPGGANFAFVDCSVRFIRDSIQCWQVFPLGKDLNSPPNPIPAAVTVKNAGKSPFWDQVYALAPKAHFGVYQALSTRNGHELVSADDY